MIPSLYLGAARPLHDGRAAPLHMPAHHLVTHGVIVGMTGSGKTGLVTVMVEEALRVAWFPSLPELIGKGLRANDGRPRRRVTGRE